MTKRLNENHIISLAYDDKVKQDKFVFKTIYLPRRDIRHNKFGQQLNVPYCRSDVYAGARESSEETGNMSLIAKFHQGTMDTIKCRFFFFQVLKKYELFSGNIVSLHQPHQIRALPEAEFRGISKSIM